MKNEDRGDTEYIFRYLSVFHPSVPRCSYVLRTAMSQVYHQTGYQAQAQFSLGFSQLCLRILTLWLWAGNKHCFKKEQICNYESQ